MGKQASHGNSSPDPSNFKTLKVELFVFSCGHGDTIVIHLPDNRWCLVDCNLKSKVKRQGFLEFLDSKEVERFDFIFQTHPDLDHFGGMKQLLQDFIKKNGTLGYWCDGGVGLPQIQPLAFPDFMTREEYDELQDYLDDLYDEGKLKFYGLDAGHSPVTLKGHIGKFEFYTIAPDEDRKRIIQRADAKKLGVNPETQLETNKLSLVIMLSVRGKENSCNILLTGDADDYGCTQGLEIWNGIAEGIGCDPNIGVVKVSHHGSISSHCLKVVEAGRPEKENIAVISCGKRDGSPDREVMRDYLSAGWTVLATTERIRPKKYNHPFEIINRGEPEDEIHFEPHNITITWSEENDLEWEPRESEIIEQELGNYETKK